MIRHIVLVRFDPETSDDDKASLFGDLAALQAQVPGMIGFAGGPNVSAEGLGKGFTHAFCIDFESAAARDAYLVHPAHQAAGGRLTQATAGGVDGLVVVDIAIDPGPNPR